MNCKNLVFFMTDQQRADTIGMEVGGVPVTPALTRLANESAWFRTAYNACPLCVPARTALATGVAPMKSGAIFNDLTGCAAPKLPTLHKMLYDAGYEVAHIGVNHVTVSPPLKTALPFAAWEDDDSYAAYASEQGISVARIDSDVTMVSELCENGYQKRPYSNERVTVWPHDTAQFKDVWFCEKALAYLQRPHEKPFALFVCLWAPHPPLQVPAEYLKLFPAANFSLPKNTALEAEGQPVGRRFGAAMQLGAHVPKENWRQVWSAHCALTRLCDDRLALILQALQKSDLAKNTVTVCTVDHGEQLGQHCMYQKMEMYEPAVRVPAVFSVPDTLPASFHTPISHLDFLPTVLDLLGVAQKSALDGISLANSIRTGIEPPQRDIFGVYCGNHSQGDQRRMVVRGSYKYVFDGSVAELYCLADDPLEMHNLANDSAHAELCAELHSLCAAL